jgi:hypothetical protein
VCCISKAKNHIKEKIKLVRLIKGIAQQKPDGP